MNKVLFATLAIGAATALPIIRLACALHNGMATFAEAAVSGRDA